ncbi:hypothetical protein O5511_20575 [Escherichia coli]|nr:hypothetical protein [Escherichia coli]
MQRAARTISCGDQAPKSFVMRWLMRFLENLLQVSPFALEVIVHRMFFAIALVAILP